LSIDRVFVRLEPARLHLDLRLDARDFESHINLHGLPFLDRLLLDARGVEAPGLDHDVVRAGREVLDSVLPFRVGLRRARGLAARLRVDCDGRADDDSAARVCDGARD
jgi:hypothetical protein